MAKKKSKKRILVLSPTYTAGSWMVVKDLLTPMTHRYEILGIVLGDGKDVKGMKTMKIPYPLFENFNPKYGGSVIINAIYQIPLQIGAVVAVFFFKPHAVISNGFAPLLASFPLLKLLKIPAFVYYGSYLTGVMTSPFFHSLFQKLNPFVTRIFVNSTGSAEEVVEFLSPDKPHLIEHWTDMKLVNEKERKALRKKHKISDSTFVLTFVGRLVEEKGVRSLIDLIKLRAPNANIKFWFVGNGKMLGEVSELTKSRKDVDYKGFITDRKKIREIYGVSDLLWTFADESYVARPGIEALAVGCPLMLSNTAAVIEKYAENIKIKNDLIPNSVGWIIEDSDIIGTHELIDKIVEKKLSNTKMRKACQKYAAKKHSKKNVENAVKVVDSYV